MKGASLGVQAVALAAESERLSDLSAAFVAPVYTVKFGSRGEEVGTLEQVHKSACVLIDQAVEAYAPMDLVKFSGTVFCTCGKLHGFFIH